VLHVVILVVWCRKISGPLPVVAAQSMVLIDKELVLQQRRIVERRETSY
jgi:hypothetical protein